ncbi:MAG: serine hydrolase [Cyanobacteria bacterium]|nr:serine hydrolase [Cyanobacteria bacterium GSL.Bin21]
MAWQNEYRSGNGRNASKIRPNRRKFSSSQKKRPYKKRKSKQPENVIPFPRQTQPVRQPRSSAELSFIFFVRLTIFAVGIGAIAGTVLYFLDRDQYLSQPTATPTEIATPVAETASSPPVLPLDQEVTTLKQTFQNLASEHPQLNPAAFIVDLDSGQYLNLQGENTFSAASMIKVPILIAFFQAWDEGRLQLDESLTMTEEVKAGGSGNMQYAATGKQYLALETAAKMIIISDNTATNMLIKRLGGQNVLNELFAEWGLEHTRLRNPLPDLDGTNTTSPKELVKLLARLDQGELVSARSRDHIFQIMRETRTRTLLPEGLDENAKIAHKTGDIGSLVGDVGMIDRPSGKRYLAAIMVERPHNDRNANELIRRYSREAYQYFRDQEKNSFIE